MNKKAGAVIVLIILIIAVIAAIISVFLYYVLAKSDYDKPEISIDKNITNSTILTNEHISYVLNELGAYKLHTPPLSNETPKIIIKIESTIYSSEISREKITTKQEEISSPDLIIYTSSQEILLAINSSNAKEYMKASVRQGKTRIELKAGYSKLFSKGYLGLYHELTGKTLTASIIRIFT